MSRDGVTGVSEGGNPVWKGWKVDRLLDSTNNRCNANDWFDAPLLLAS